MNKIKLLSFGFKYGQPSANYYFDVSFIKNPARESKWDFFSSVNDEMKNFVLQQEKVKEFLEKLIPLIITISKLDQNQIFAFGCNAGRHRSVILVEYIKEILEKDGIYAKVEHRNLE